MYSEAIAQLARNVQAMSVWLDKAEHLARSKRFDIAVLLNARLAPDMGPLIYQVQSACDYVKGGAAWLSGRTPPRHEDNERTVDDVRERIRKTVAFVETVGEDDYADAARQTIRISWSPAGTAIMGEHYLLQIVIPNVFFHVSMAYAILRHNGVDVGKMDFLNPIDWVTVAAPDWANRDQL